MITGKKRFAKALMILAVVIAAMFALSVPAGAATIPTGDTRVASTALNLRKSCSTNASILAAIPKGTFLKIKGTNGNGWYKVTYQNSTGYVKGTYLKTPFSVYGDKYTKYMLTDIVMRSAPNQTSSTKMMIIPYAKKVFVIARSSGGSWYKVWYNGKVGYIISGYFKGDTTFVRTASAGNYLRKSPSTSSGKVVYVNKGSSVVLLSKYNATWYKVRCGSYTGYMKAQYLNSSSSGSTGTKKTMKTAINMRSSRSSASTSNIICVIPAGATVTVVESYSDGWYGVTYNGKSGYIKGGYFA